MPVPKAIAARVLFFSDRRCCVCRGMNKSLQIHHIDGDSRNHACENLAVLCLDCHAETQKHGGFCRRLDAEQVRLYRAEWMALVGRSRRKGYNLRMQVVNLAQKLSLFSDRWSPKIIGELNDSYVKV